MSVFILFQPQNLLTLANLSRDRKPCWKRAYSADAL